MYTKYQLTY